MKKCITFFIALIILLGLVGCNKENTKDMTNADNFLPNIQMVKVTFYSGSDVHEWELAPEETEAWIDWLNRLTIERINSKDEYVPNEIHECGSRYIFEINTEKVRIQYVDSGSLGVFLLAEDVWYKVSNPEEPFNRF